MPLYGRYPSWYIVRRLWINIGSKVEVWFEESHWNFFFLSVRNHAKIWNFLLGPLSFVFFFFFKFAFQMPVLRCVGNHVVCSRAIFLHSCTRADSHIFFWLATHPYPLDIRSRARIVMKSRNRLSLMADMRYFWNLSIYWFWRTIRRKLFRLPRLRGINKRHRYGERSTYTSLRL